MPKNLFLTDITTSEGNLKRFTEICLLVNGRNESNIELNNKIKNNLKLTNFTVISRHLSIMEKIFLIKKGQSIDYYIINLDTFGKLLYLLTKNEFINNKYLSYSEKVIYSYLFFNNFSSQLKPILDIMDYYDDIDYEKMILTYFYRVKDKNIWSKNIINKGFKTWEKNGKLIRSFINRYKCMEMWLKQLDLINININKLTLEGEKMLQILNIKKEITCELIHNIYSKTVITNVDINKIFEYDKYKEIFINKYNEIKEPTGFADLQLLFNISNFLMVEENAKILPNIQYNIFLNKLWEENLIKNLSKDNKGILKYIILN